MAFDQNSMPNDLRPLNIVRAPATAEDPRISAVTSSGRPMEGFYANPSQDVGSSPNSFSPVYYQTTVPDAGFVPLGYNSAAVPGITGWVHHVVPSQLQPQSQPQPQPQPGLIGVPVVKPAATGSATSSNLGTRVRSSPSDQASEESGGDGSVSGRKIKFLCSFGGNIFPRPSDGALRYVGGQTRIISVRRDISFGEFVQKLGDVYAAENVVIKYQLPDEDLDALVSVSCPDDLDNMMDEYEKLLERSTDGSAKLRIFLFGAGELDNSGLAHLGYLQDNSNKYVEAVNGITDGFSGGSCSDRIARKESLESAISGQGSDLSGTEGADSLTRSPREVTILPPSTGGLSPKDASSRMVSLDSNTVPYSAPSMGVPPVSNFSPTTLGAISEQEMIERSVPQASPVMSFPATSPYGQQSYIDPHQETSTLPNYVQMPSQMGFPPHMLGHMRPVLAQQPIAVGTPPPPQQYTPGVHMTINPSYLSMNPNAIQPQHVQVEHYPAENSMVSQRLVQIPAYSAQQQAQVPTSVHHNWTQIAHPEPIALPEGGLPPQQTKVLPENTPRFEDCFLCQKALPHAHSDTIAQELKETPSSTISDFRSNYHSLLLDDRGRAVVRPVVAGTTAEANTGGSQTRFGGNEDPESVKTQREVMGVPQNYEGQFGNDKAVYQKAENLEHAKVTLAQGVMMTSGVQYPYGVFVANTPQSYQANVAPNLIVQPQLQVIHDTTINKPVVSDISPAATPLQTKEFAGESSNDYSAKVAGGVPVDDSPAMAFDHVRQISRRLENLHVNPSEVCSNEHNKPGPVAAAWKENAPEVTEPPPLGIQDNYSLFGAGNLHPGDASGNSVYAGGGPAIPLTAENILPVSGQKDNIGWPPSTLTGEGEALHDRSPMLPTDRVGDIADNLASVLTNQDPWNMMSDTHFPPPKPSKLQIRRENDGMKNAAGDNCLVNTGEALSGNCKEPALDTLGDYGGYQPSGNLNWDLNRDNSLPSKSSAEELIKQELQAVAEGVASSVLNSSVTSNTDQSVSACRATNVSQQNGDDQPTNAHSQLGDAFDEIKTKLTQKINFGFPASGVGRLQIIKNSDLEELRELGSGTFGTVYHGKWRGTDVAIKRINDRCFAGKPSEQDRLRDDFWNEAIKLADLHHPNVVAFYGVVLDGPDGSVATVTEYMVNGSLRTALQKNERSLDKRKRLLICMDVAFGMEYLHGKNIVHFDLKSDNLLVNLRDQHRPICKVGDLGLSKVKCQTLISGGVRGTLPWMAPELLNGSSSLVSEKVDVFSFGIVMWELITGEEPYADLHYGAIIGGIVSNTLRPPVPEGCDPDWRALMERCWASEYAERPNFTEIANELRAMAAKLPTKGQVATSTANPQVKS